MTPPDLNLDPAEQRRFDALAASWWDPEGESRPLHELNPARLRFITEHVDLDGRRVVDIGCGGGILSEALAAQGAEVIGIDIAAQALAVARLHLHESELQVDYRAATAEQHAAANPASCEIVTCMELLEHVPEPVSVLRACADLLKPGGSCFLSTLNRTPASFAMAIVGAEHIMGLIPKGTHRYDRFIRPSELAAWLRASGLELQAMRGLHYNPFTRTARLGGRLDVNYLAYATKPGNAA